MSQKAVLVAGDLVLDHHIYEGRRQHYGDSINSGVRVFKQVGGAALIHDLLEQLFAGDQTRTQPPSDASEPQNRWQSRLAVQIPNDLGSIDESQHAFAFWRPFPSTGSSSKQTWRVSEAMGFGAMPGREAKPGWNWRPAEDLPSAPHAVVLSDGGMGFREDSRKWANLNLAAARWILLKTASPLSEGPLWEELVENHRDRLIVLVSARELRKSVGRISQGLSWESTLEDVLRELRAGEALAPLMRCRHLLIALESEGGIWVDVGSADDLQVHFVYDAGTIEGEHAYDVKGTAFGFLSCLAAATVRQLALDAKQPDLEAALEGGLSAMRDLREKGHGPVDDEPHGFPAGRLARVIKSPVHRYSRAVFSRPAPDPSGEAEWSLLVESQKYRKSTTDLARLIVLRGPIALENLPHLAVGDLMTVDRSEIESLRTLSQLVRHYHDHDPGKKPLSIGVFGPPGAGKSFAVKELAKKLVGEAGWMEFNLSQFDTPADLIGAYHQIRDQALQNILPVAFFDEFDSQQYRWLQYLLAPMQDGRFQEGQLTHPLGKCIFIFAGATSWTFETFGPPAPQGNNEESEDYQKFRLLKGPDFKSRLDGFLDVIGPNRRQESPPPEDGPADEIRVVSGHRYGEDQSDIYFPIRRAVMIRGEFRCRRETKLEMDEGVVHALLNVDAYRYGSRSLNKVLRPLKLALPGPLHRSPLPPKGQLDMQTDAEQFLKLVHEPSAADDESPSLSQDQIHTMGQAIHKAYDALGLKEGWATKSTEFEELDDFLQRSNFAAAERMVEILALVGLGLDPSGKRTSDPRQVRQHLEYHLELLADAEHEGWMQWHFDNSWRHAPIPKKDAKNRLHPSLIPYRQLSDEDKNKDRNQIRNYPNFAKEARMSIFFVNERSK